MPKLLVPVCTSLAILDLREIGPYQEIVKKDRERSDALKLYKLRKADARRGVMLPENMKKGLRLEDGAPGPRIALIAGVLPEAATAWRQHRRTSLVH